MNVIGYDEAHCLFPAATFNRNQPFNIRNDAVDATSKNKYGLRKYSKRHFPVETGTALSLNIVRGRASAALAAGPRWFGDRFCWTRKLEPVQEFDNASGKNVSIAGARIEPHMVMWENCPHTFGAFVSLKSVTVRLILT